MFDQIRRFKDYVFCAATLGNTLQDSYEILWRTTKNLRVGLRLDRHHPKNVFTLDTVYGTLHFRDNFGDITNLVNILYREEYRIRTLLHPGVILDVGANIGMAAVWFAHYNPSRSVFCFEPLQENTELIRLNCPKAKVFELALAGKSGTVSLQVDPNQVMASAIPCAWPTEAKEFVTTTLDAVAAEEQWDEIALLKMDVEGMEIGILQGATATLQKTHQVILETHGKDLHDFSSQFLIQAGFQIESDNWKKDTGLLFASRT